MYHLQVPLGKLEVEKLQGGGGGLRFVREGLRLFSEWGEIFSGGVEIFSGRVEIFFFWGGGLRNFKRGRESSGGVGGSCEIFRGIKKLKLCDPNLN